MAESGPVLMKTRESGAHKARVCSDHENVFNGSNSITLYTIKAKIITALSTVFQEPVFPSSVQDLLSYVILCQKCNCDKKRISARTAI